MSTKNYSVRISDESLNNEVAAYAKQHGIPASTAIVRLLMEGMRARAGKPITRFAVVDPEAPKHYSLALGELRNVGQALQQNLTALRLPRPMLPEDQVAWTAAYQASAEASGRVQTAIERLKHTGRLEFLLVDVPPDILQVCYQNALDKRLPVPFAIYAALLGKTSVLPPMEQTAKGKATAAPVTSPLGTDKVFLNHSVNTAASAAKGTQTASMPATNPAPSPRAPIKTEPALRPDTPSPISN